MKNKEFNLFDNTSFGSKKSKSKSSGGNRGKNKPTLNVSTKGPISATVSSNGTKQVCADVSPFKYVDVNICTTADLPPRTEAGTPSVTGRTNIPEGSSMNPHN